MSRKIRKIIGFSMMAGPLFAVFVVAGARVWELIGKPTAHCMLASVIVAAIFGLFVLGHKIFGEDHV